LVGVVAYFDLNAINNPWVGVRPIYQNGGDYVWGEIQGEEGNQPTVLLAEHGHVVTSLQLQPGEGLSLTIAPVVDGQIKVSESQTTPLPSSVRSAGTP
jgi:hypothetical protein